MSAHAALNAILIGTMSVCALATNPAYPVPVLLPNHDGTYGTTSRQVAVFPSLADRNLIIERAEICGFANVFVGERPEGLPVSVEPASYSDAKLACFKRWADAQKTLKVDWLK